MVRFTSCLAGLGCLSRWGIPELRAHLSASRDESSPAAPWVHPHAAVIREGDGRGTACESKITRSRRGDDALQPFETEIYVLNPSLVDGFKRAYTKLPKTDALDAFVIADRLRFGGLRPTLPQDPRYAALQRLTRFRYNLVQNLIREKNRALGMIFLKFSPMCDDEQNPFSDPFGKAATACCLS